MIELLLAIAAVAPTSSGSAGELIRKERVVTRTRVPIPREIFHEIRPYLDCLMTQTNNQLRALGGAKDEDFPKIQKVTLGACETARESAKVAAVKGLGGTQVRRADRPEYVERVLVAVEDQMLLPPSTEGIPK